MKSGHRERDCILKRYKTLALLCLFLAVALNGCVYSKHESARQEVPGSLTVRPDMRAVAIVRRPPFLSDMSLDEAQSALADDFSLAPDRRFLMALSNVRELVRGDGRIETVDVTWREGRFRVSLRGKEIGSLSEFAGFNEMYALLLQFAISECRLREFKPDNKKVSIDFDAAIKAYDPSALTGVLARADREWSSGKLSKGLIKGASECSACLSSQMLDWLAVADGTTARALALAALSDATKSGATQKARALIADSMGFAAESEEIGALLKADDPFKQYLRQDAAALRKKASSPGNHESAYLYLRLVCQQRDRDAWRAWLKEIYPHNRSLVLPALKAFSEMTSDDWLMQLSFALARTSTSELTSQSRNMKALSESDFEWTNPQKKYEEASGWMLSNLLKDFEDKLKAREDKLYGNESGPSLFGKDQLGGYYRSYFYSSIAALSKCYLKFPSSRNFLDTFAQSLKVTGPPQAKELSAWLASRIALSSRSKNDSDLAAVLSGTSLLGPPAQIALFEGTGPSFNSDDLVERARLSRILFDQIDSRPGLLIEISKIAEYSLLDLRLSRRLVEAALASKAPRSINKKVERAISLLDIGSISVLLKEKNLSAHERAQLVETLALLGAPLDKLEPEYAQIVKSSKNDWWAVELYADALVRSRRYAKAASLLTAWLNSDRSFVSDDIPARVLLAKTYAAQNRLSDAWSELDKPGLKKSRRLEVLLARARLSAEKKDYAGALDWANNAASLYPDDLNALSLKTELLLRLDNFEEAAKLLSASSDRLTRRSWTNDIGRAFVRALGGNWAKVTLAAGSFKDAGLDSADNLGQIAHAYYIADRPQMAFNLLTKVSVGQSDAADYYVCAYRYLKRWKGKENALDWLKREMPAPVQAGIAPYAFISGQYNLLFNLVPTQTKSHENSDDCLLRAAAYLIEEPRDKNHLKLIDSSHVGDGLDRKIIAYLMDEPGAESLLSEKLAWADLGKAAFFVGWKELSLGDDFADALKWYRVATVYGARTTREQEWSVIWLRDIVQSLADKPRDWKRSGLTHLRVAAPLDSGHWSRSRRFRLVMDKRESQPSRNQRTAVSR